MALSEEFRRLIHNGANDVEFIYVPKKEKAEKSSEIEHATKAYLETGNTIHTIPPGTSGFETGRMGIQVNKKSGWRMARARRTKRIKK